MKLDIDRELEELKSEFEERISKIENKYKNIDFYKLIPAILNKIGCDYLELSFEEVNKNNSKYIANYVYQSNKIIVQKQSDKSNEI